MGIPPDEVMAKPKGVRDFMFASMRITLEQEQEQRERMDDMAEESS